MSKHKKFWDFIKNDAGERVLRLEGPIDSDNFWGDEITPKMFREELESGEGDITVWINSPGGSVLAAAEIYTMLCDYKGKVTVKIDAIAASAASVVAMAGERVLMSPVAMLMLHDPMTMAMGNAHDMEKVITTLNEIKESIINAYVRKTGLSRNKVSKLMSDETWLNARKAVELGFADEILFTNQAASEELDEHEELDEPEDTNEPNEPDESANGSDGAVTLEGGDEQSGKSAKTAKTAKTSKNTLWGFVWQPYSTRAMGEAIINRLIPAVSNTSVSNEANNSTADNEAILESGLTATAEKAPQEIQKTEEETSSEEKADKADTANKNDESNETKQSKQSTEQQLQSTEEQSAEVQQATEQSAQNEQASVPIQSSQSPADDANSEPQNANTSNESDVDVKAATTEDTARAINAINTATADTASPDSSNETVETVSNLPDDASIEPREPRIGLDGKAKDGSMPYALLEKQLQFLK